MAVLKSFMEELQKELELQNVNLESTNIPGAYEFPLSENLFVTLSENEKEVMFDCALCPTPGMNKEEFFSHALHANLFFERTLGATLGLDGSGNSVILNQKIDYTIDYEKFKEILEDFCNTAEQWVEESASFENS